MSMDIKRKSSLAMSRRQSHASQVAILGPTAAHHRICIDTYNLKRNRIRNAASCYIKLRESCFLIKDDEYLWLMK